MILLDTNVLSEFMRVKPSAVVVDWLDRQPADRIWISAITRAEIELGIALLADGRRKRNLAEQAALLFEEDFAGRCLAFDGLAAQAYARIVSARTDIGRPISVEDAQIAAIAVTSGLRLATQNTGDFLCVESLQVVDPWQTEV